MTKAEAKEVIDMLDSTTIVYEGVNYISVEKVKEIIDMIGDSGVPYPVYVPYLSAPEDAPNWTKVTWTPYCKQDEVGIDYTKPYSNPASTGYPGVGYQPCSWASTKTETKTSLGE